MKNFLKYSLRTVLWLLISTTVLLLLLAVMIQLKPVKQKIAQVAGKQVSKMINGEFNIEEIQGNFFSELVLKNISLRQETDTVLFLSRIKANYNLFPLLSGKVEVYYLGLEEPGVMMEQVNDSTWNFNTIMMPAEKKPEKSNEGSIDLNLDTLEILKGNIEIISQDTLIPRNIKDLNIAASFNMEEEDLNLVLSRFGFFTYEPDFLVENISFIIDKNQDFIQLSNLSIKTSENRIEGRGDYSESDPLSADAEISTTPIETGEFEFLLGDLKIPAKPVFQFDVDLRTDSLNLLLGLYYKDQEILIKALSPNFRSFLDKDNEELLNYNLQTELRNIDLNNWMVDSSLDYKITGVLNMDGLGVNPETAKVNLYGRFNDCLIQDRPVDSLFLSAEMYNGDLKSQVKASGDFGFFSLIADLENLFEEPQYFFELMTRKLDVAPLTGIDSLDSDLNLILKAKGQGFTPKDIRATAFLDISTSYFQQLKLDTLSGHLEYQEENLGVEHLDLKIQSLMLNLSGNFNPTGETDLLLNADFEDLSGFDYYLPVSDINSEGTMEARVHGIKDSINLDTKIILSEVNFQGNTAKTVDLNGKAVITKNDTLADFRVSVEDFGTENYSIASLIAYIEGSPDELEIKGEVNAEEFNTDLIAVLKPEKTLTSIALENWNINYKDEIWQLQQTPALIELDSVSYRIANFNLVAAEGKTSQLIKLEGQISRTGRENLKLKLVNLPVEKVLKLTDNETNASGFIFLDVNVNGSADSPVLKGNFRIEDAILNDHQLSKFNVDFNYENQLLSTNASIIHSDSGLFRLSAGLPFIAAFDSMKFKSLTNEELSGSIEIKKFPVAILQTIDQIDELTGYVNGSVDIGGSLESLDPRGEVELREASLKIPRYGIDYNQMAMKLNLSQNAAVLDSILIRSEDGKLSGFGKLTFSSEIYKGDLSETEVTFQFDDFNPVNHPQFNMQLDGQLGLKGEEKNLVFNGDIVIPEAEVFIPAVMNMMGQPTVPDLPEPLLLRELKEDSIRNNTISIAVNDSLSTDTTEFNYFEKIEGSVNISIPRNVWIKNEDMYIEIMGDLQLLKNPAFFEVFGSLNVVRGQYNLMGRTFVIDKGVITFQGGEELTPNLDFEASYTFRNTERVEQTLEVFVTGNVEQPQVSFRLDGNSISEGDALAYIMFGKSMNELGMDQQDNVAEKAAANLISSQLTGYLSEKLDVDYIEVKTDDGFDNATVVVGKYITNDLFVSYEQKLGDTDEQEVSNYEVRLEYELFRFLFIELNNSSRESGFDLIFKKDFK